MREIIRDDDGALLGYLRPHDLGWEPLTVFGYPLGAPSDEDEAEDLVRQEGLACLTGRWEFRHGEEWYTCVLLEADMSAVRVRPSDPGYPGTEYSLVISDPVRLRPA